MSNVDPSAHHGDRHQEKEQQSPNKPTNRMRRCARALGMIVGSGLHLFALIGFEADKEGYDPFSAGDYIAFALQTEEGKRTVDNSQPDKASVPQENKRPSNERLGLMVIGLSGLGILWRSKSIKK